MEIYLESSDETFNTEERHQMMQVPAIVNQIRDAFEENDSYSCLSKVLATELFFSLLKATNVIRNVFKFF